MIAPRYYYVQKQMVYWSIGKNLIYNIHCYGGCTTDKYFSSSNANTSINDIVFDDDDDDDDEEQ